MLYRAKCSNFPMMAKAKKRVKTREKPVKLNITLEDALKRALNTPVNNSKKKGTV